MRKISRKKANYFRLICLIEGAGVVNILILFSF